MSDGQPLAQELLTYTPPGGTVRVPLTVAVDVRASFADVESAREMKAVTWGGYHYARIDMRGTLSVRNRKAHPIDLEITCEIGGRATKADPDAAIVIQPFFKEDWTNYRGDPAVNNHSTIRWRIPIEAGKAATATVDYHFFRRQ